MTIELEINLKINGKILFGCAQINEEEFNLLRKQDRWDLERYLRQILADLGHGVTEQVYLHDRETVRETLRGEVEEELIISTEATKLIESLPILNGEAAKLIGNPDGSQEG